MALITSIQRFSFEPSDFVITRNSLVPRNVNNVATIPFKVGDTLQITESDLQNNALVTVQSVSNDSITVKEELYDESGVVITKVVYPADVKMGVVNMVKWELDNRDKVGVASETISRHSVTYFDMSEGNSAMGFPKAVLGFLRPYMKARFGQGLRV